MARNIYIVDDDAAVRASLLSLLSVETDCAIYAFRDGDRFLAEAPELEDGVLLLDFNMPGSSGIQVMEAMRALGKNFATVILTGQASVGLAVQAMKAGALDLIEQPYEARTLMRAVDQAFTSLALRNDSTSSIRVAQDRIGALSPRERDVLTGLIEGHSNKVIAIDHDISPRTVEIYRANLMKKLSVHSLSEALRIAFAAGLIPAAPAAAARH
jgi:two-component system response regulator FixJ